jgi:hypothetical protein
VRAAALALPAFYWDNPKAKARQEAPATALGEARYLPLPDGDSSSGLSIRTISLSYFTPNGVIVYSKSWVQVNPTMGPFVTIKPCGRHSVQPNSLLNIGAVRYSEPIRYAHQRNKAGRPQAAIVQTDQRVGRKDQMANRVNLEAEGNIVHVE